MGCPIAAYKEVLCDYIQNSFKLDKELKEKYNEDYLYSLDVQKLEDIIKRINPEFPQYNAMMAGLVFQAWTDEANIDQCNAMAGMIPDFFKLFGIEVPENTVFVQE